MSLFIPWKNEIEAIWAYISISTNASFFQQHAGE